MSTNQVLQTTVNDINGICQLMKGNTVTSMRQGLAKIQNRLCILQQTLTELRANENVVKGRIYNNLPQSTIQIQFGAGKNTQVTPKQAFDITLTGVSTDQGINSDIFKAITDQYGLKDLCAELNRIDNDIQSVQAQMRVYESELTLINSTIKEAENTRNSQQSFVERATGKSVSPTTSDFEIDKIQKSVYANVYLLYNLAVSYLNYSVDDQGNRKYPDDSALPTNLMVMRQVFWAHVQQFPKYLGVAGTDVNGNPLTPLNTSDPGSDQNLTILGNDLAALREVGKSNKTTDQVAKYVSNLTSLSNDGTVSEGVAKKDNPSLPASNSMNAHTKNFATTSLRLGVAFIGSFELPSLSQAISKMWKKKNATLFKGLPICPNVPKPPQTSTDTKQAAADAANLVLQEEGAKNFQDAVAKAKISQYKINTSLPADSPEWVKQYATTFLNAPFGSLRITIAPYPDPLSLFIIQTYSNNTSSAGPVQPLDTARNAAIAIASSHSSSIKGDPTVIIDEYAYYDKNSVYFFGYWYSVT